MRLSLVASKFNVPPRAFFALHVIKLSYSMGITILLYLSTVFSNTSICGEEYNERSIVCVVKCKHAFHPTCIDRWYTESSTCPYCRSDIVVSSLIDYRYETNVKNGDVVAKITLTTM
ncbi:hypothetical protein HELRODRAFT_177642 [Helobdella robusta]|uniref:RING-type E3 ubiquitin transferase n=1 Tax=Helobdella robusta TaxID=6412 RepID=T1FBZ8_HELRO|nr:hypothetical protein HELRODRAFT_177642 [Helobdella robusta]ESN97971.1 hypothetical protein HELRODRAFT_177642 [Helobdella robusta]